MTVGEYLERKKFTIVKKPVQTLRFMYKSDMIPKESTTTHLQNNIVNAVWREYDLHK